MWPFNKPTEDRASYTEAAIRSIVEAAGTPIGAKIEDTAAAQTCANLLGRCLAMANVTPDTAPSRSLTPRVLYQIGRSLMLKGESVWLIDVADGGVRLTQAASWDIHGQRQWRYRLTMPSPDGTYIRNAPAAQVLHPRINVNEHEPHRGVSPLGEANLTASILAYVEKGLSDEMKGATGWLLPAPIKQMSEKALNQIKADLKVLRGKTAIVPSMADSWGDARSSAPRGDWIPNRMGANPPEILETIRQNVSNDILAAGGVPADMYSSDGKATGSRESLRQYLHSTLQPIADQISTEVSEKLQPAAKFDFEKLMASDVQGRARAFQSMVQSGMDLGQAAALSGLLIDGDVKVVDPPQDQNNDAE